MNPLARIHFKPPAAPPVEPYTQEELKRFLAVCDLDIKTGARFTGLRNRAMLLLFLDAGLRRTEMATLKLRDLHLEARRITVIGKGNKLGVVPFCPKTAKAIWLYLIEREARAKSDSLWVTEEVRAIFREIEDRLLNQRERTWEKGLNEIRFWIEKKIEKQQELNKQLVHNLKRQLKVDAAALPVSATFGILAAFVPATGIAAAILGGGGLADIGRTIYEFKKRRKI